MTTIAENLRAIEAEKRENRNLLISPSRILYNEFLELARERAAHPLHDYDCDCKVEIFLSEPLGEQLLSTIKILAKGDGLELSAGDYIEHYRQRYYLTLSWK